MHAGMYKGMSNDVVGLDRDVLYNYDMASYTIHYKSNNNVVYS